MDSFAIAQLPDATGKLVFLVGSDPVVLTGWYDPRQRWFDFMQGAIWTCRDPNHVPTNREQREARAKEVAQRKIDRKTYAHMPNEHPHWYRKPYVYQKGVEQHVLPFVEFKRLSNTGLKDIAAAGYPTWDRNPADYNRPHKVHINDRPFEPGQWCLENFDGRFHCNAREIVCEKEIDAVRAKLVFG